MNPNSLLIGLAILLGILWFSTVAVAWLQISFPPALLGMLILFLLLYFKIIPLSLVEGISEVLISKMGLLFLPAGVSIMLYLDILSSQMLPFVATVVIGNFVILIITAKFTDLLISQKGGKE